jgi:t-SNARE complex subunit (syntaxin)
MQILVEAQDTTVTQIEEHATQVQTNMEQGVVHVEKALESAKAARRVSFDYILSLNIFESC